MQKVYKLNTEQLDNPEVFDCYYAQLSCERRQKIDSMRQRKGKLLSLGAGILTDKGLKEYGLREAKVRIALGENEKPYFPDYPEIHFNVSHSEKMVLAVFADTEVGCDIEYVAPIKMKIAQRFFCPSEYEFIMRQEEEKRTETFYRFWTLKESFMKATGLGMKLSMDSFCVSLGEEICVEHQLGDVKYHMEEWEEGEYRAAMCYLGTVQK